jgi:hypothetical protein
MLRSGTRTATLPDREREIKGRSPQGTWILDLIALTAHDLRVTGTGTFEPPPALQPAYETRCPNASIPLHRGRLALKDASRTIHGRGRVAMILSADTRIEFSLQANGPPVAPEEWAEDAELQAPGLAASAPMVLTNVVTRISASRWTSHYTGLLRGPMSTGTGSRLDRAVAHIFNLQKFFGSSVTDPTGGLRAARADLRGGG